MDLFANFVERYNSSDWTFPTGQPKIFWWDYTYISNSAAFPNNNIRSLPSNFISGDSSTNNVKLKDGRGSVKLTGQDKWFLGLNANQPFPSSGSAVAATATDHEWGSTNGYDHNHISGPTGLENNQLMWMNGKFRPGYQTASAASTNSSNHPYIDYTVYVNNTQTAKDYSVKADVGEFWNYSPSPYYLGTSKNIIGYYKWIVIEDTNTSAFTASTGSPAIRNNGVEVYLNSTSKTGALTLGEDYIMFICMEGSYFQNNSLTYSAGIQYYLDNTGATKYRTGWLDCQVRPSTSSTFVENGAGCGKVTLDSGGAATNYLFVLPDLNVPSVGATASIDKIYYRIGIKNADSSRIDLESVYIDYTYIA